MRRIKTLLFALGLLARLQRHAHAERLKDLATVAGVRTNQLFGYGLVVGLDGTGDQTSQTPFTIQSITNMLAQFGVPVPASAISNAQLKNVAAVTVTADLPPFTKAGQPIDVTVSSIGNASSLRGGSLLMTPLRGVDGQVYAFAQGSMVVSGFGVQGKDGSKISVNVPSAGRIPERSHGGARGSGEVRRRYASDLQPPYRRFHHRLASREFHQPDSRRGHCRGRGCGLNQSIRADDANQRTAYVATLEAIEVEPGDPPARVIINSRTGTVVISSHVQVTAAAVAHGSLSVTITERTQVSQPNSFTQGTTATVTPKSSINVKEGDARMFVFQAGVNLDEIVRAVNQVGAAPGDLVAILEALQQAGALRAQLMVI